MQGLSSVSLLLLYYSSIGPLVVGVFHASATGDLALPARVPAPLAFDDAPLAAIQFRHQAPSRQRPAIPAPARPQAGSFAPFRPIPIPRPPPWRPFNFASKPQVGSALRSLPPSVRRRGHPPHCLLSQFPCRGQTG